MKCSAPRGTQWDDTVRYTRRRRRAEAYLLGLFPGGRLVNLRSDSSKTMAMIHTVRSSNATVSEWVAPSIAYMYIHVNIYI